MLDAYGRTSRRINKLTLFKIDRWTVNLSEVFRIARLSGGDKGRFNSFQYVRTVMSGRFSERLGV
jgi:hypothetical protein